jgi:ribosomal protein L12E/L44/L45/RPP1/RPP2
MSAPAKPRSLTLRILRSAPGAHVEPQWQDFAVEEAEGMTLFIALNEIRQNLDPRCSSTSSAAPASAAAAGCSSTAARAWPAAPSPKTTAPPSRWRRCRSSS